MCRGNVQALGSSDCRSQWLSGECLIRFPLLFVHFMHLIRSGFDWRQRDGHRNRAENEAHWWRRCHRSRSVCVGNIDGHSVQNPVVDLRFQGTPSVPHSIDEYACQHVIWPHQLIRHTFNESVQHNLTILYLRNTIFYDKILLNMYDEMIISCKHRSQ